MCVSVCEWELNEMKNKVSQKDSWHSKCKMWVCVQVVSREAASVLGGAIDTQGCCYNVAAG